MFHITCTPAHINIHGISRLHNLGVGFYMIYMTEAVPQYVTYTCTCTPIVVYPKVNPVWI